MCCLRYEHEFYVQSRKRFPKEGKLIRTKRGEEKVLANDIFRDRVTLRGEDGEVRTIELAELRNEAETVGVPLPPAPLSAVAVDDVGNDEDVDIAIEEEVVVDAIVVQSTTEFETVEPPAPAPPAAATQAEDARERRPHRRRGRRGGRRNRQGGGGRPGGEGEADGDGGGQPDGES